MLTRKGGQGEVFSALSEIASGPWRWPGAPTPNGPLSYVQWRTPSAPGTPEDLLVLNRDPAMLTAMTGYAATALGYLAAQRERFARVPDIARERGIPRPFLAKIVRKLSARGMVRTRRGVGGGVALAVDPARLSLLDLCRALDEPALLAQCVLGQATCSDAHACPLHEAMVAIRAQQLAVLERTSLLDIGRADAARRSARRPSRRRRT